MKILQVITVCKILQFTNYIFINTKKKKIENVCFSKKIEELH